MKRHKILITRANRINMKSKKGNHYSHPEILKGSLGIPRGPKQKEFKKSATVLQKVCH